MRLREGDEMLPNRTEKNGHILKTPATHYMDSIDPNYRYNCASTQSFMVLKNGIFVWSTPSFRAYRFLAQTSPVIYPIVLLDLERSPQCDMALEGRRSLSYCSGCSDCRWVIVASAQNILLERAPPTTRRRWPANLSHHCQSARGLTCLCQR